ncbi:MAG: PSP1 C-terminal domain-containing protein [Gemmataceae bacterium]
MIIDSSSWSGTSHSDAEEATANAPREFIVGYGSAGDFGRFRPTSRLSCRRGDEVVVQTHRGLELGKVLCEAQSGHARHLPNTSVGQLVRKVSSEDRAQRDHFRSRERDILAAASSLVDEMALPVEMIDAEILLDGKHVSLLYLRMQDWDPRPFVSTLSRQQLIHVFLEDLSHQSKEFDEDALPDGEQGCGQPGCGKIEGGACSSCGTGGGCSTCGSAEQSDLKEYFSDLREKMNGQPRTPLL